MRRLLQIFLVGVCLLSTKAFALTATVSIDPDPPSEGANALRIELTDDGRPVTDAQLSLLAFMPAMGTMPRMESPARITPSGKGYNARFDIAMSGTWELTLTVDRAGKQSILRYSVTTGVPGVQDKNLAPSAGAAATVLDLGPERLQRIGVRFAEAKPQRLTREIRAVALVEQDKTHREEVTLRVSGYLAAQLKGRVGDQVKKGEALFRVYSPELVAAQSDYLLSQSFSEGGHPLHESSAERLKNLGLTDGEIKAVKKAGKAQREVTVRAPIGGTILEINAREGAAVEAGQVLYVIGDLSKTYLVAKVFQQDLLELKVGQRAGVLLPGGGGRAARVEGRIDLIYPQMEQGAGTGNVRVELEPTAGVVTSLAPGSYADLRFPVDLGECLAIPVEAVLHSGLHAYVFVDRGGGNLEAREVETGRRAGDLVEIRAGLVAGERVAASGTFLISSEAQLRSALPRWSKP